ncbi:TetR/AcrR family transcriptional regulator [Aeromonas schubertii]|uniref:TetR family transcriptional regulator n=1 Tax=Aeromonas schubertii TaxID=652 RepID=A0A0S2SN67_9GAMM|nr:TetR/AcrR family transcriptional regulator [Aeromonas schubertii]ALP43171.1 TetR family transcriptional regulator [Aeromonas schubertii]KUE78530.1 TetR family transcriptional regulator [Aeromonas schubertii]MBZ6065940.1 TetR/AcrR family transcriptional regulator [Aeromonas schubertii]MBZ6072698.1 TetR/AcrR family transcriptional regulator [Aeromonas schubertii]QCG49763.1 TetR/AcrR family transcriptional regulator [Aeromonas schubertii]
MKTRDRIIHGATELFNEQGERNVTTNHIAAHLGISPGNLYYHFRNKEDIIHSIFDHYTRHLAESFAPVQEREIRIEHLMGYLDAIFYLMWQFRFFYANLPDILSRDELLQQKYLRAQEQLASSVLGLLRSLRDGGLLLVSEEDMPDLGQTIKMVVTFWIAYQIAQAPGTRITKPLLYKGVLKVLFILRPYLRDEVRPQIAGLEQHYRELAG